MKRRRIRIGALFLAAAVATLLLYLRGGSTPAPPADTQSSAIPSAASAASTPQPKRRVMRPLRGTVEQRIDISQASRTVHPGEIGRIEGQVLSHDKRVGIAGAELTFDNGALHIVRADEHGQFTFSPPQEGVYELARVTALGHLPFSADEGQGTMVFTARQGAGLSGARVYLLPAVEYVVSVVTAGEAPVAVVGAQVRVLDRHDASESPIALGPWTTDENGEAAVHAHRGAILQASHPEHGVGRTRLNFGARMSHRLTVRLAADDGVARDAVLSGTVFADGEPLEDVIVTADFQAENPAKARAALEPARQTRTDDSGRFTFNGLRAGQYDLVASAAGFAPINKRGVRAPSEDVKIELEPGGRLLGKVVDAQTRQPIASFVVVVQERLGPLRQEVVVAEPTFDPDGEYDIPALPSGRFRVSVTANGFAPSAVHEVLIGKEDIRADFALERGETLTGVVLDEATQQPIEGARVSLEGNFGGRRSIQLHRSALTDKRGAFALAGVAPGPQSLLVAAAEHHGKLVSVEMSAKTGELRIELPPTEDGEEPHIELAGIGAILAAKDDVLIIGGVIEGGGAKEAGLTADDAIVAIDGIPVVELGFAGSIRKIRGPVGSTALLSVRKLGSDAAVTIAVVRRKITSR